MKSRYSTQKMFSILCALILLVSCFSVLSACQPTHTCQSVCKDCGKCLNANCVEKACAIKCPGHHVCESLCPTCNNCTDADCVEAVCANKCAGHHSCTSQCEKCGQCQDLACTESVCAYKCPHHNVCQSVCIQCKLCTDFDCEESACEQKCEGHHVCYFPCSICGKCIHNYVKDDPRYMDKCKGHDTCVNPCPSCGGCTGQKCKCSKDKISCNCGYPWWWNHLCQNVCEICGWCTNSQCTQEPCTLAQCPGHDAPLELTLANEPITEWVYTELTPDEEKMLLQAFCDRINIISNYDWADPNYAELISYYGKIGDKYFYSPRYGGNLGVYMQYYIEHLYLISDALIDEIFVYTDGISLEIDDAYKSGLVSYDEIVILTHYLMAYQYRLVCLANGIEITEPIKVNVIARIPKCGTLFFIGEQPTADSTKTPRIIEAFNIDYTKKSVQYGTVEFPLFIFGGDSYGKLGEEIQQREYLFYAGNVWEFNEYFNLYLESIY